MKGGQRVEVLADCRARHPQGSGRMSFHHEASLNPPPTGLDVGLRASLSTPWPLSQGVEIVCVVVCVRQGL